MPGLVNHINNVKMLAPSEQISDDVSEDYGSFYLPSGSSEYNTSNLQSEGESMEMAFNNFSFKLTTQQQIEQRRLPRLSHRPAWISEYNTASSSSFLGSSRTYSDYIARPSNHTNWNPRQTITEHSDITFPRSQDMFQEYNTSSGSNLQSLVTATPECIPCTEGNAYSTYKQSLLFSQSQNVINFTVGQNQGQGHVGKIRQRHRSDPMRHRSDPMGTSAQMRSSLQVTHIPQSQLPTKHRHLSGTKADTRRITFNQTTNGNQSTNASLLQRQTALVGIYESDLTVNEQRSLDIQDNDGDTCLMILLITDDVAKAEEVIKDYATNPNLLGNQNAQGLTALMISVIKNQPTIVKSIVSLGVSLDTRDNENNTALHHACKLGNVRCAKYIVTAMKKFSRKNPNLKAIPTWKNEHGDDCLALAVNNSRLGILDILVEQCGIGINTKEGTTGNTPLHIAVEKQDINLVNHLLGYYRSDVIIDQPRYDGCTPLQLIYHKDGPLYVHIKSLLLEAGAQVENFAMQDD